jgi:hypothetical protein
MRLISLLAPSFRGRASCAVLANPSINLSLSLPYTHQILHHRGCLIIHSQHCPSILFRPLRSEGTQPLQMAGSSKKASPKSPKRTRQGKATVPKTGSSDFNNEDYNIRSPERTKLLTKIKGVIKNAPISPVFWACCQLADMNYLQDIAKTPQQMILVTQDSLASIAARCEFLGFWAKSRLYITVDMLTVNRDSAIPGFGFTRIRGSPTFKGPKDKETQTEF